MSDSTDRWQRAGIPNVDLFQELLYNDSTGLIIARLSRSIQEHPFGVLYVRGLNDKKYEVLADESESGISFNYPVTVIGEPYLFVLTMKAVEQDGRYIGYNNIGIRKIDLNSRKTVITVSDTDFVPEPPYSRIWASTIVGHKSENTLFCSVGMQQPNDISTTVDYHLCSVDIDSCAVDRLSKLHETFL